MEDQYVEAFSEEAILCRFMKSLKLSDGDAVLDVGCGYGRRMKTLRSLGIRVVGVDVNPSHVRAVRELGFECMTVEEYVRTDATYAAMLMSHVIEHFSPHDLLPFIDGYLDRLRPGGHLVIATPLLWSNFYADFDHIRPYDPMAITEVFAHHDSQAQYHSRNRLELVDIGLRRCPRRDGRIMDLYEGLGHLGWWGRMARRVRHAMLRFAFRVTQGRCGGQTNGWVGLFRKADSCAAL